MNDIKSSIFNFSFWLLQFCNNTIRRSCLQCKVKALLFNLQFAWIYLLRINLFPSRWSWCQGSSILFQIIRLKWRKLYTTIDAWWVVDILDRGWLRVHKDCVTSDRPLLHYSNFRIMGYHCVLRNQTRLSMDRFASCLTGVVRNLREIFSTGWSYL